jgi:hypothetical protein
MLRDLGNVVREDLGAESLFGTVFKGTLAAA